MFCGPALAPAPAPAPGSASGQGGQELLSGEFCQPVLGDVRAQAGLLEPSEGGGQCQRSRALVLAAKAGGFPCALEAEA